MKKTAVILLCLLFVNMFSQIKVSVDLIIKNAKIYTVNNDFEVKESMAILNGKIVELGSNLMIQAKFRGKTEIDLQGKFVYPGFTDAHAHFFGYGNSLQQANLKNTKSWTEVLDVLKEFSKIHQAGWLIGRGWDQNDWKVKDFPTKEKLDEMFPDRPVFLTRIDGHAAIANQKALDLAKFDENSTILGGDFIKKDGKLTGVLIDNAKDKLAELVPPPSQKMVKQVLVDAQKNCFAAGITAVHDAGLDYPIVDEILKANKSKDLKIRLNVMLSDKKENIDWILKTGKIKTSRLRVAGFKFYADGALGSRGACLLKEYSDKKDQHGFLLSDVNHFREMAKIMYDNELQMNTHAIGDSANRVLLSIYGEFLKEKNDRRWRIEHAQVIHPSDFYFFQKYSIIPSVQPTHATSDMSWAKNRLGDQRLKSAYAYKELLNQNGWIPLGTDFPIEDINPLLTFYAAVARKDTKGSPKNGFQKENALSREETLKGMTIWAAKAGFDEAERGSLELGKMADFVVLDQDIMTIPEDKILETQVIQTWVDGEKVFDLPQQ